MYFSHAVAALLMAVPVVTAAAEPAEYLPVDPFPIALYAFGIVLLLALYSLWRGDKMSHRMKQVFFVSISILVVGVTLYAAASTVYLNVISESGGPVHWHADFEIWVCGEPVLNLERSTGFSNRIGSAVFHHHNDYRMHVEGVVVDLQDVSMVEFFTTIGGEYTHTTLEVKLEGDQTLRVENGDLCNGQPGTLKLYVNDEWSPAGPEHVLAPYFNTRIEGGEGDVLKIIFDEEGVNGR